MQPSEAAFIVERLASVVAATATPLASADFPSQTSVARRLLTVIRGPS